MIKNNNVNNNEDIIDIKINLDCLLGVCLFICIQQTSKRLNRSGTICVARKGYG